MDDRVVTEMPAGRVLPRDIRCVRCKAWVRGGPSAWGMAQRVEHDEAGTSDGTLRAALPWAGFAAGLGALYFFVIFATTDSGPRWIPALVCIALAFFAVLAAIGSAKAAKYDKGTLLTVLGFALGLFLAPLLGFLVALFL